MATSILGMRIGQFDRYGMCHYDDVIMTILAYQITSLTVVYSIVYSGVNQRKHQSSASLAFVREIHRGPVNFPHKWPVTRKMFPFDDVIMYRYNLFDIRYIIWYLSCDCVTKINLCFPVSRYSHSKHLIARFIIQIEYTVVKIIDAINFPPMSYLYWLYASAFRIIRVCLLCNTKCS